MENALAARGVVTSLAVGLLTSAWVTITRSY